MDALLWVTLVALSQQARFERAAVDGALEEHAAHTQTLECHRPQAHQAYLAHKSILFEMASEHVCTIPTHHYAVCNLSASSQSEQTLDHEKRRPLDLMKILKPETLKPYTLNPTP